MNRIRKFEPLWGVWKCEEVLGEGSFGRVYKAVRRDGGRVYCSAVKHISVPANEQQLQEARRSGLYPSDVELSRYFGAIVRDVQKEIDFMYTLKGNANIVSYEDHMVIPKEDGIGCDIFIRMEILKDLNSVSPGSLYPADVVKIGTDICTALEVCRKSDIIHRDIKPSNIFISPSGDYKLGDFGIAKVLGGATTGVSKKGTYAYMSPEIYKCEPVNFTTDIYSLGVVLYRLLNNNRLPFIPMTGTVLPKHSEEALMKMVSGAPMPPPKNASPQLAAVILKACAYDKRKRFQTAAEFKQALTDALYGKYQNSHTTKSARAANSEPKNAAGKPQKAASSAAAASSTGTASANAAAALARKKSHTAKLFIFAEAVLLYFFSLILDVMNSSEPSGILLLFGAFAGSQYLLCKSLIESRSKFRTLNIATISSFLFASVIILLRMIFPDSDILDSLSFVCIMPAILSVVTVIFLPSILSSCMKKSHNTILSVEICIAAVSLILFAVISGNYPFLSIWIAVAVFIIIALQYDALDRNKFTSKSFERLLFVQLVAVFAAGTLVPALFENLLMRLWIGIASIAVLGIQCLLYCIFATKKGRNITLTAGRICCIVLAVAMVFFCCAHGIKCYQLSLDFYNSFISDDHVSYNQAVYDDSLMMIEDIRSGAHDSAIIAAINGETTGESLRNQYEERFNVLYNNQPVKFSGDPYVVSSGYYTWFCEYTALRYEYKSESDSILSYNYTDKASEYRTYADWCYEAFLNAESEDDFRSIIQYLEERSILETGTLDSLDESSENYLPMLEDALADELLVLDTYDDILSDYYLEVDWDSLSWEDWDSLSSSDIDTEYYLSGSDLYESINDVSSYIDGEDLTQLFIEWFENYESDENSDG